MGKIKINQISDSELEVFLDNDVPLEMVEQLSKGLEARGLFQDNSKSSLGRRTFIRAGAEQEDVHEKLMKSLEKMIKADEHTKLKWEQQRQSRLADRNKRRASMGMSPITMDQMMNPAGHAPEAPKMPTTSAPSGPNTLPGVVNRVHNPEMSGTVNYAKKSEDGHDENDPKCGCMKCSTIRKANLNKSLHDKLKGNSKSWGQHNPFPSAHQPDVNKPLPTADDIMANQLRDMMMSKNMMRPTPGVPLLGSVVPPQPTDEQLFGHLVPSEEMLKAADRQWKNGMNDFWTEAAKPISSRFKSEEEELAYWKNLKVSDKAHSVE